MTHAAPQPRPRPRLTRPVVPPTPANLRPTPPAATQASLWQPAGQTPVLSASAPTVRPTTIQGRFDVFLAQQPDVYAHFRSIALDLWRRGVTHYGAKAIVEVVRYHRILQGVDADGFRINNDYTSRLARRAIEDCPELSEFFELRQIKSA